MSDSIVCSTTSGKSASVSAAISATLTLSKVTVLLPNHPTNPILPADVGNLSDVALPITSPSIDNVILLSSTSAFIL